MIYLDITRLLNRLKAPSPTGIDRVEFEYARHALASGWCFVAQDADHIAQMPTWLAEHVVFHLQHRWERGAEEDPVLEATVQRWRKTIRPKRHGSDTESFFRDVRSKSFLARLSVIYRAKYDISKRAPFIPIPLSVLAIATAPALFAYLFTPKQPPEVPTFRMAPAFRNSVYLNVGHTGLEKTNLMKAVKERADVRTVIYVHDLLPITHPALFPEKDVRNHAIRMRNVKTYADHIVVNSKFTRDQFEEKYGAGSVRSVLEIGSLPTVHTPSPVDNNRHGFVTIGTIEPRKNYIWLVKTWLQFVQQYPTLVNSERLTIFGKRGWLPDNEKQELFGLIEGSNNVEIISGSSDEEVKSRLRSARAYVTAAEVEGWGMPLAESLSSGTPVIATDIPAHREVTQGHARFFLRDYPQDLCAFLRSCFDVDAYSILTREVAEFKPWNWQSHFKRLDGVMRSMPPG